VAEKKSTAAQVNDQYVTAILVTHNGVTWLSEVVASLSSQKHLPDQIIAVDNGSIDGSVKLLSNLKVQVLVQLLQPLLLNCQQCRMKIMNGFG